MMGPWLPSELWAEIEIRRFGDRLTYLGQKNRSWAVKQWALVMLHTPISEELRRCLVRVKAAGPTPFDQSELRELRATGGIPFGVCGTCGKMKTECFHK